jgi:hypothetical protein
MSTYNTNRMETDPERRSEGRRTGTPGSEETGKRGKAKRVTPPGSYTVLCLLPILSAFFSCWVDDHAQGSAV